MSKIVINALKYKQNSSGAGVIIRELFCGFACVTQLSCAVVLSKDSPDFAADGAELIYSPYLKSQNLYRLFFQYIKLGLRYCTNTVLLTVDSKIPLIIPRSCKIVPIVTDLAVYRMRETYQLSRILLWRLQYEILKRKATHFIAISECTKSDLIELLDIYRSRFAGLLYDGGLI